MATPAHGHPVVFLLDCDDTLLDNDALKSDLDQRLRAALGDTLTQQFWRDYELVRGDEGTIDFPRTLDTFRASCPDDAVITRLQTIIFDYPFAKRLYPEALATLSHLRAIGLPAILSDGDQVYQPLKIQQSGLAAAVGERVAIYIHKEDHLDEVMARWPGAFYVFVDDKARILAAIKQRLPGRSVTVHVRQGHYGLSPERFTPAPDLTLNAIGELRGYGVDELRRHL